MVGRYWFLYKKSMDEKINERDQNSGIGTLFMGSAVQTVINNIKHLIKNNSFLECFLELWHRVPVSW